jgi:hypothetical protein
MVRHSAMVVVKVADRQANAEGQNEQQQRRYSYLLIPAFVHQTSPSFQRPEMQSGAVRAFHSSSMIIVFELMFEVKHKSFAAGHGTSKVQMNSQRVGPT